MRKKFRNFEHLISSEQRWFSPNFRIFGCLCPILAQSNGPRKFNIPFGMYLVHTIITYRLKILPNTTHTITVCTYVPGTTVPTAHLPCTYNVCELSTGHNTFRKKWGKSKTRKILTLSITKLLLIVSAKKLNQPDQFFTRLRNLIID